MVPGYLSGLFRKFNIKIAGAALMGVIALIGGQFIVERVFVYSIPISVFITVAGGIYFLYLILKGSRHN